MQLRARSCIRVSQVLLISALALALAMGVFPARAAPATPAAPSIQFGIGTIGHYPKGYFIVKAEPGASANLAAAVVNVGQVPADLEVYAANAVNPVNGGFAAADKSMKPAGGTSWLSVQHAPFTLAPSSQRSVPFTVTVPAGTPPGQYITALVASTAKPLPVPGGSTFRQIIRSTVPVEIDVPGPVRPGFTLGQPRFVQHGTIATLNIPIANTGNILVKPAGTLIVTTPAGTQALQVPVAMLSVYAGLSTRIEVDLPPSFAPGDYQVSLTLKDPGTGATASVTELPATLAPPAA